MALFAISDLHLGAARDKTMDRFGPVWQNHLQRLTEAWHETVSPADTVLLPGDLSWAMRWVDFEADLRIISELPGHKVISRGNHDYYWRSKTKMKQLLPPGVNALDQSGLCVEGYAVAAIKGWLTPETPQFLLEEDEKFFMRERSRLQATLHEVAQWGLPIIVQMHFPPWAHPEDSGFTDILERYAVKLCLYGHLHNGDWEKQSGMKLRGVRYQLVSADYLAFRPLPLQDFLFP